MTVTDALLQGIIQGFTEFLPVSSDGHISVYQHFTSNYGENALTFTLILHIGTLLAVFITYRNTIFSIIGDFFAICKAAACRQSLPREKQNSRNTIFMLITATLPLFGFVLVKDFITALREDEDIVIEGICFLFTAFMLFFSSKAVKGRKTTGQMTVKDALTIGFFQGLAILPGVSRSGSTISAGLLLGYSKEAMVEFSFILSIPAILGACILDIPRIVAAGAFYSLPVVLAGLFASAFVGLIAIKLINYLVINDKFIIFSYYTFILGIIVLLMGIAEYITGLRIMI